MDAGDFNPMALTSQLANLQVQNSELPPAESDSAETAKQFEALLATMLVKEMRKSLPEGFFGKGPGSDTFGGWLDKSIGDQLVESWDVNLAGMVKTSLDSKQRISDEAVEAPAKRAGLAMNEQKELR